MKQLAYTLLIIVFTFTCAEAKPPFGGTIFVNRDIITPDDPTAFESLSKSGKGQRKMFDRRASTRTRSWSRTMSGSNEGSLDI